MGLSSHHDGGYIHPARSCKRTWVHGTRCEFGRDGTRKVYYRGEAEERRNSYVVNVLRRPARSNRLRCNSPVCHREVCHQIQSHGCRVRCRVVRVSGVARGDAVLAWCQLSTIKRRCCLRNAAGRASVGEVDSAENCATVTERD